MPTRTRSKTGSLAIPGYLFKGSQWYAGPPPGTPAVYNSSLFPALTFTSGVNGSITDVTGNYGKANNVSHVSWELVSCPSAKRTDLATTIFPLGGWNTSYSEITLSPGPAINWGKNSTATGMSNIEGLKTLAITRVPKFATRQLMGAVSLVELGDTFSIVSSGVKRLAARLIKARTMASTAKRIGIKTQGASSTWEHFSVALKQDMARWWNQNRELITGESSLTKTQITKLLTGGINADLWWKFGIEPFIRDVEDVQKSLRDVDKIVSSLLKGTRVYGRATDVWDTTQDVSFSSDDPGIGRLRTKCRFITRRTATASVMRKVKASHIARWRDGLGRASVLADSLGLIISREDIWEVTPFSFMIDWIWDFQSALESSRGYSVPSDLFEDTEQMLSVKQVTDQSWSAYYAGLTGWSMVGSSRLKSYTRTAQTLTGQPVAYVPPLKLPNFEQWFTGLEILVQHLTFPKGVTTARRG